MSENTKVTFSVDAGTDVGTVPGITQLLNPKVALEKIRARKGETTAPAAAPAPEAAPTAASAPSQEREISLNLDEPPADFITKTTTQALTQSIQITPLAKMGVFFELHFENQHGNFRYTRMKPHSKATLELWQQKFFFQMKIDLKALEIQVSFQEFAKKQSPFHEDAFGMVEASYVQIVRLESDTQKIFVLFSNQSLLLNQEEVRAALSGQAAKNDDSDDFKIELAS